MKPEGLISNTILKYALIISALIYLFSLYQRVPHVDDAWLGEIVYYQSTEGHPRSELMRGVTQQEVRSLVHHKLLTLGGSALSLLFGFKLITLKSLSLLFYALFLLTFTLYLRKKNLPVILPLLLLLVNSLVFEFSFVFRPESMLMCLAFWTWIYFEKVTENDRPWLSALLAGLFSGLAIATHLNGLFLAAAGGIVFLLYFRKYLLAFIPGLILTACIYFYDFTPEFNISFWWSQIAHSPFIEVHSHSVFSYIGMNILEEQMRFFNGPKEFTMTLLILFSAYILYKLKGKFNKYKFLYIALVIALMGTFSAHKTAKYMMLYLPFFVLLITQTWLVLARGNANISRRNTMVFLFLMIAYISVNSFFNVRLSAKKFFAENSTKLLSTYIKEDFSSINIVAPMTYIFNNIGDFRRIHSDLYYSQAFTKQQKDFSTEASNFNIDYIFLENYHSEQLGIPALKKNDTLGNYVVLDRLPDLTVLHKLN